jgi:hypothetical protein
LASLHLYREQFSQAAHGYGKALLICFLGVTVYRDESAANLVGLGSVALGRCRNALARRLAIWAVGQASLARNHSHQQAARRLAAAACLPLGRYEECWGWLNESGAYELPGSVEQMRAWVLRGRLEFAQATMAGQQPRTAAATFQAARQSALLMHDLYSLIETELGLGWCALVLREPDVDRWLDAAEKKLTTGSNFELWGWHMFLVAARKHRAGASDASAAYLAAEEFCRQHAIPSWMTRSLVGRGAIQWHQGDGSGAEALWRDALRRARKAGKGLAGIVKKDIELCRQAPSNVPR